MPLLFEVSSFESRVSVPSFEAGMAAEKELNGLDLIDNIYTFVAENRYPEGATVGQKRTIRRKAAKFEVCDGELFYKKTTKDEIRRKKRRSRPRKRYQSIAPAE